MCERVQLLGVEREESAEVVGLKTLERGGGGGVIAACPAGERDLERLRVGVEPRHLPRLGQAWVEHVHARDEREQLVDALDGLGQRRVIAQDHHLDERADSGRRCVRGAVQRRGLLPQGVAVGEEGHGRLRDVEGVFGSFPLGTFGEQEP